MDIQPDELLRSLVGILEKLQLRYFVTGSVAAMFYGEPRFTNDIDVVVDRQPKVSQESGSPVE